MATLSIVFWRDIPAQVIAKAGRRSAKRQLADRFQVAIDQAAMQSQAAGTDAYLEAWRRDDPVACGDDLDAEVDAAAVRIETEYDDDRLRDLIASGGRDGG